MKLNSQRMDARLEDAGSTTTDAAAEATAPSAQSARLSGSSERKTNAEHAGNADFAPDISPTRSVAALVLTNHDHQLKREDDGSAEWSSAGTTIDARMSRRIINLAHLAAAIHMREQAQRMVGNLCASHPVMSAGVRTDRSQADDGVLMRLPDVLSGAAPGINWSNGPDRGARLPHNDAGQSSLKLVGCDVSTPKADDGGDRADHDRQPSAPASIRVRQIQGGSGS